MTLTLEERLQAMIGQQAFAIASLQVELEKAQIELAKVRTELMKEQAGKKPDGNGKTIGKAKDEVDNLLR